MQINLFLLQAAAIATKVDKTTTDISAPNSTFKYAYIFDAATTRRMLAGDLGKTLPIVLLLLLQEQG